ncbi:MAG: S1C family serine protease, partial [candidate division Zixibacteria bacterium]|nr:S1C family serine protease [candidate division Zixibacteria bacterium]
MNRRQSIVLILAVAFLGAVFGSLLTYAFLGPDAATRYAVSQRADGEAQMLLARAPQSLKKDIPESRRSAIVEAAEKVGPAVVSISVTQTRVVRGAPYFNPFGGDDMDDLWSFFLRPREFKQKVQGIGSGVITDPRGYVLTNQHVVDGAEEIRVTLPSGEEYKGKVIGEDAQSDLAVLKIDGQGLPYARLGN